MRYGMHLIRHRCTAVVPHILQWFTNSATTVEGPLERTVAEVRWDNTTKTVTISLLRPFFPRQVRLKPWPLVLHWFGV